MEAQTFEATEPFLSQSSSWYSTFLSCLCLSGDQAVKGHTCEMLCWQAADCMYDALCEWQLAPQFPEESFAFMFPKQSMGLD